MAKRSRIAMEEWGPNRAAGRKSYSNNEVNPTHGGNYIYVLIILGLLSLAGIAWASTGN